MGGCGQLAVLARLELHLHALYLYGLVQLVLQVPHRLALYGLVRLLAGARHTEELVALVPDQVEVLGRGDARVHHDDGLHAEFLQLAVQLVDDLAQAVCVLHAPLEELVVFGETVPVNDEGQHQQLAVITLLLALAVVPPRAVVVLPLRVGVRQVVQDDAVIIAEQLLRPARQVPHQPLAHENLAHAQLPERLDAQVLRAYLERPPVLQGRGVGDEAALVLAAAGIQLALARPPAVGKVYPAEGYQLRIHAVRHRANLIAVLLLVEHGIRHAIGPGRHDGSRFAHLVDVEVVMAAYVQQVNRNRNVHRVAPAGAEYIIDVLLATCRLAYFCPHEHGRKGSQFRRPLQERCTPTNGVLEAEGTGCLE